MHFYKAPVEIWSSGAHGFAMLRSAGQKLYEIYHWPVHYLRISIRHRGFTPAVSRRHQQSARAGAAPAGPRPAMWYNNGAAGVPCRAPVVLLLLLLFIAAAAAEVSSVGSLSLTVLPESVASATGARCLDSSPASYYSSVADPERWVVYLQGGGECESRFDCHNRAKGSLGSSKENPEEIDGFSGAGPICGRDPKSNPDFAGWSALYIPYCSGDDWLGSMKRACDAWEEGSCDGPMEQGSSQMEKKGLFHAGHNIIDAVLDHAAVTVGFSKATTVVISGGSAGGQGAYYHSDWLSAKYSNMTVISVPEYGWFGEPFDSYADWVKGKHTDPSIPYPSPASNASAPAWVRNVKPYIFPACAASVADPFECASVRPLRLCLFSLQQQLRRSESPIASSADQVACVCVHELSGS